MWAQHPPKGDAMANEKLMVVEDVEVATNSPSTGPVKTWGYVSAQPSEYLVVFRNGKLAESSSGQGARHFKWPGDTVAVIPTTLKEVLFQANQITQDNVDVRLRGMVVYRIVDPLRICRLINFADRQAGEAKLARMIADVCRSNAKALVSNMTLERCMRQRKEEIASALKNEVSRLTGDAADLGVGVVTVDIQDVYVQDAELFAALQARFKAEAESQADLAKLTKRQELERHQLAAERDLAEQRHTLAMEKQRRESERELAHLAEQRRNEQDKFELEKLRVEDAGQLALRRVQQEAEREQVAAQARQARAIIDTEARQVVANQEIAQLNARLAAENQAGPAALERLFIEKTLPGVAEAVSSSLGAMRLNVYQATGEGGAATPLGFVLQQVLTTLDGWRRGGRLSESAAPGSAGPAPAGG